MSEPVDEKKVDALASDIYEGLTLTVEELQRTLPDEVDSLTTKQLRRALKNIILYPDVDEASVTKLTEREQRFTASMIALRQAGVQLEIKAIGELQREYDMKQQAKKEEK